MQEKHPNLKMVVHVLKKGERAAFCSFLQNRVYGTTVNSITDILGIFDPGAKVVPDGSQRGKEIPEILLLPPIVTTTKLPSMVMVFVVAPPPQEGRGLSTFQTLFAGTV